jgi:hypothetical protein
LEHFYSHFGTSPASEQYGAHSSDTIPSFSRYFHTFYSSPPLHPISVESHITKLSGEKTSFNFPFEAMHALSEKASEAANAQHEPHLP